MEEFDELLEVADILLSPKGCPWDRKQTMHSLQTYLIEEAHEVIEAIDQNNTKEIYSELGDLLYSIIFLAKIAEKKGLFSIQDSIIAIRDKLIRRHPHVFGDLKDREISSDEIKKNWEKIKAEEKEHEKRESVYDGIPNSTPLLIKAQKMLSKAHLQKSSLLANQSPIDEKELTKEMLALLKRAAVSEIDVEGAFRRGLADVEKNLREEEKSRR